MASPRIKTLLVSILTLGRPANVERQLDELPQWLDAFGSQANIAVSLIVRNNAPGATMDSVARKMDDLRLTYPDMAFTLVTGGPNVGFGRGHNANYGEHPADAVLILNDDIGFPHIDWLQEAVALIEGGDRVALVGATDNPQYLSPFFGNGNFPDTFHLPALKYAEASILLALGSAFAEVGMFNDQIEWAMCEDADLSLRVQQHGYSLAWLPMPHQHWRSTSFNSLPGPVRSSILEGNRATLFATWRQAFTTGRVGRYDVYDLWSDGLGDVFCALPHLRATLAHMTPQQRANVVVNSNSPDLMPLLGYPEVKLVSFADVSGLQAALASEGVSSIRSLRPVNYALPFSIHALVSGGLGLPAANRADYEAFGAALRDRSARDLPPGLTPGAYCVVHLEFLRDGHHGRALAPAAAQELVEACSRMFETVVLVGKERRLTASVTAGRIVDLQGGCSAGTLLAVLAQAGHFVGIDSYPSHVAQAAGVPSAIVFGSVHPLSRVWTEERVWPISAALDCIGCYHSHVEPSVPFCMRQDQACMHELSAAVFESVLGRMREGRPHDWTGELIRFRQLQARLVNIATHHPAPPQRLFRGQSTTNEQVSNMIYQIVDNVSGLVRDQYETARVQALTRRAAELEARNNARDVEIQKAARLRWQLEGEISRLKGALRTTAPRTSVVSLAELFGRCAHCIVDLVEDQLEITSEESDPQIFLTAIEGTGGQVQLRLSANADADDVLEVFWSHMPDEFSEMRKRSVGIGPAQNSISEIFLLREGERLWIRIDPLATSGRAQIRGAVAGAFKLPSDSEAAQTGNTAKVAREMASAVAVPSPISSIARNGTVQEAVRRARSGRPRASTGILADMSD